MSTPAMKIPCAARSGRISRLGSFTAQDVDGQELLVYVYQVVRANNGKRLLQLMTAWGAAVVRVRRGRYLLEDGREFLSSDPIAP